MDIKLPFLLVGAGFTDIALVLIGRAAPLYFIERERVDFEQSNTKLEHQHRHPRRTSNPELLTADYNERAEWSQWPRRRPAVMVRSTQC